MQTTVVYFILYFWFIYFSRVHYVVLPNLFGEYESYIYFLNIYDPTDKKINVSIRFTPYVAAILSFSEWLW